MIAEDEVDIRNLVATMAQVWGHDTMTFESGKAAWAWLDKVEAGEYDGTLPDFALMDIRMPGHRGDEVAKRIRSTDPISQIPIVLMTAFVLSEDEMREMKADTGVDHIINKPLPEFNELRQMLEDIIEQKKKETSDS
jgi:CheY-like chemotaxis protein